jgi:hypothetical protein
VDIDLLFSGIAITDLAVSRAWYTSLFGRPPDVVVADDEVMWNVSTAGWIYIVVDHANAGHSLAALSVTDLDRTLDDLSALGLGVPSVLEMPGGARKANLRDPDGNAVAVLDVTQAATG